jgi:hypothetical protein
MQPVANFRVFQVYLSRQELEKNKPILVLYWDTPDRRRVLIDPFLYEHAARGDVESRVAVLKVTDAARIPFNFPGSESVTKRGVWKWGQHLQISQNRGAGTSKTAWGLLGGCRAPNSPFRATFR